MRAVTRRAGEGRKSPARAMWVLFAALAAVGGCARDDCSGSPCGTDACATAGWDARAKPDAAGPRADAETESRVAAGVVPRGCDSPVSPTAVEFAYAKMLIEHNGTDEDTGFQGALDGVPWSWARICGPEGPVMTVETEGNLTGVGLTELFFETQEPPNSEIPIPQWLANLPEGKYRFLGETLAGLEMEGSANFTHAIPSTPLITNPAEDAVLDPAEDLVVAWNPVTTTLDGKAVTVTHYQLVVELDEPGWDAHQGFGASKYDVTVPASTTQMRVPAEFLAPGAAYDLEVLAIEESGNQTIGAISFSTKGP